MADEPDLVDVLVADHDELRMLLDPTTQPAEADDEKHLAVTIAELVRHLVVEEDYLYPAVRETVPDGGALATEALQQSARTERWAKQIEELTTDDVDRAVLLRHLRDSVLQHVRLTEAELFPRLRQHCAPNQLRFLAGQVEMAKRTAPTRPHPHAPRTPPWNQILTPGLGLVDRIRDAMTGRPNRPEQL
jgi:hemerythrin-like domain-containing protein